MNIKNFAAVSMLTIGGVVVASGTSLAAPARSGIHYTAHVADHAVVINTDAGSLDVVDGQFQVRSKSGQVLAGIPLAYHLDNLLYPIEATVSGHTATLRPITDPRRAVDAEPAAEKAAEKTSEKEPPRQNQSYKSQEERDKAAWDTMTKQVGFSVTVGAIIGAVVAALAGCVVGGVVAAPTVVVTAVLGPLAGCASGAVVMAPIGAVGGTLFVAAPVAVASAIQYYNVLNAPF